MARKISVLSWLPLFFLIITSMIIGGCSGGGGGGGGGAANLSGFVYDINYNPISNANVTSGTNTTNSLSNGKYLFSSIGAGIKNISILATGFTPGYKQITVSGGQNVSAGPSFLKNLDGKITPIGSSGGTAYNSNGSIKMIFPSGALSPNTPVVLTAVQMVASPFLAPAGKQFVSYIVYAKPDITLTPSAELYIPNLTSVTNETVAFYRFDTGTFEWKFLANGGNPVPTMESNPIKVVTPQMGWIAAIMPINPAPAIVSGVVKDFNPPNDPIKAANVWTITANTVTNNFGQYEMSNIPPGTIEVFASALGYVSNHIGPVTVTYGTNPPLTTIFLTAQSQGNISGIVKNAANEPLANARVVESGTGGVAYSETIYGRYTIYNIPTGATNITVYASGYESSTEPVTVQIGQTVEAATFRLNPAGPIHTYYYNFETTDEAFTKSGLWHWQDSTEARVDYFSSSHEPGGITRKVFLVDPPGGNPGQIPPAYSGKSYFWFGQATPATVEGSYIGIHDSDDTSEGSGGRSISSVVGTLESTPFDLKGYSSGRMSFWTWWEIEGLKPATGYDRMQVLIAKDPSYTDWVSLGYLNPSSDEAVTSSGEAYTTGGLRQPGIWVNHSFDLTPYIGGKIKIRFRFDTVDQLYNGFRGWFIDDMVVTNEAFGVSSRNRLRQTIITVPRN